MNGVTTRYTLDLSGGLSQVLQAGEQFFLYGEGRLAQSGALGWEYFLPDGQGSVRQIAGSDGSLRLNQNYTPYGQAIADVPNAASIYGFDGE